MSSANKGNLKSKGQVTITDNPAAGIALLVLIGLPIFGLGLIMLYFGINKLDEGGGAAIVPMIMGAFLGIFGLGVMLLGFIGRSADKEQRALEDQFPDQPWLWRKKWENGVIRSNSPKNVKKLSVYALIWGAVGITAILYGPWRTFLAKKNTEFIAYCLLISSILMIITVIYKVLRSNKYGNSVLYLETFPGVIGGWITGVIRVPAEIHPKNGFTGKLICVKQYTSNTRSVRSPWNSRIPERLLWEHSTKIEDIAPINRETEIPVEFSIPDNCSPTTLGFPGTNVTWRIHLSAATAGINYACNFDVPVFLTSDSPAHLYNDESYVDDIVTD